MGRLRRWLAGDWVVSVWTGALVALVVGRIERPHPVPGLLLLGGLYALAVHGLMQLFGLRRWGWVVAGLVSGPVPFALLWSQQGGSAEERGGGVVAGLLLGVLLGLVRWARESRRADRTAPPSASDGRDE